MSNIKKAFENGKAFIAFVTCGDPDLETTAKVVRAAVENGADLIELGIPFSDPAAEGPVIQGANLRALRGGITTDKIFAFVKELRRDVKVPMVFMTYANVVFSYGAEKFISTCRDIGIDGLILPDLPYDCRSLPLHHFVRTFDLRELHISSWKIGNQIPDCLNIYFKKKTGCFIADPFHFFYG